MLLGCFESFRYRVDGVDFFEEVGCCCDCTETYGSTTNDDGGSVLRSIRGREDPLVSTIVDLDALLCVDSPSSPSH